MEKGQGYHTFFDGQEYVSALGAAQALGCSTRTLRRWEAKGILDRPAPIPRGNRNTRWYLVTEIDKMRQALAAGGWQALSEVGTEVPAEPKRSWSAFARGGRRRQRPVVDVGETDDQDDEVGEEWADVPRRREQPPGPVLCPTCGDELTWDMQAVPGAGVGQVPVCRRCGVVDLSREPEPVEGSCRRCGGEVTYELEPTEDGRLGLLPYCPVHGLTQVHERPQPAREKPTASFPPAPVGRLRPRGLYEGFFPGAVRQTKASARYQIPLPPRDSSTRPR